MDADERRHLAEQLLTNPLFDVVMDELEQNAINRCINAPMIDDELRGAAAAETRAIRAFRSNCEALLRNNQPRKGAPA